MGDEKEMVHDLLQVVIKNKCYLAWTVAGATLGTLVKPVTGTVIVGLAGLLWASYTCKPISEGVADSQRFLGESDFRSFHDGVNKYSPVSREEALALAALAVKYSPGPATCSPSQDFSAQLEKLLSAGRT